MFSSLNTIATLAVEKYLFNPIYEHLVSYLILKFRNDLLNWKSHLYIYLFENIFWYTKRLYIVFFLAISCLNFVYFSLRCELELANVKLGDLQQMLNQAQRSEIHF